MNELWDTLTNTSLREDMPEFVASESVKEGRPFIIYCFITSIDL